MGIVLALALVLTCSGAGWGEEAAGSLPSVRAADKPDLYDIDASGLDVRFVLEALARRSGANIVVSPDIAGEVNAHLKQVSVEAILDHLATVQGFKWEKSGGAYLVASKERFEKPQVEQPKPPPLAHEVFVWECRHIKPVDLIALIEKLFPALRVAEGPGAVTPVLEAGQGITGSGSSSGSSESSAARDTGRSRLVMIGERAELEKAKLLLAQLDVRRRQVEIEVMITEISSTANKELGIDWTWSDIALAETNDSGIGFGKFTKQGMAINGALSMLIKDGRANLLAQPNISVLDGECADILIGDRILYPKLVGYNQVGAPIYDKAEEKVGVYLQIAPRIAGGEDVVMTLYPQVSLVTGYLKTQAGDYPQISTREARTTVSVRNGATLAIGGLIRDNEISNASKIPILGDLPILGQLFRHNKKTRERTEIVIFLTPRVVEEE